MSDQKTRIGNIVHEVFSNQEVTRLPPACLASTSLPNNVQEVLQDIGFPEMRDIGMFVDIRGGYPKTAEAIQPGDIRWTYLNESNGFAIAVSDQSGEVHCVNCRSREPHSYVSKGIIELIELLAVVRAAWNLVEVGEFQFGEFVEKFRRIDARALDPKVSWWTQVIEELQTDVF